MKKPTNGADGGNRTRDFGVAHRCVASTLRLQDERRVRAFTEHVTPLGSSSSIFNCHRAQLSRYEDPESDLRDEQRCLLRRLRSAKAFETSRK
jgi:hypothetical protein